MISLTNRQREKTRKTLQVGKRKIIKMDIKNSLMKKRHGVPVLLLIVDSLNTL